MLKSKDSRLHGQNRETAKKLDMPERDNSHSQQDPQQLTSEEEQNSKRDFKRSISSFEMIVVWTILAVFAGFFVFIQGVGGIMFGDVGFLDTLFIIPIVFVLGLIVAFSIKRPKKK